MIKSATALVLLLSIISSTDAAAFSVFHETYTFNATLTSGGVLCHEGDGDFEQCPDKFGTYSRSQADQLVFGATVGTTYTGKIKISSNNEGQDGKLLFASCTLRGRDCLFTTELLGPVFPLGPQARVDFTSNSIVESVFLLDNSVGSYTFTTDRMRDSEGEHIYSAKFALDNVVYQRAMTALPIPGAVILFASNLFLIGALIRYFRRYA